MRIERTTAAFVMAIATLCLGIALGCGKKKDDNDNEEEVDPEALMIEEYDETFPDDLAVASITEVSDEQADAGTIQTGLRANRWRPYWANP